MSPIEAEYFFLGKIPTHKETISAEGVLFEKERNPFDTHKTVLKKIQVGEDGENLIVTHDVLIAPHDQAEHQIESIYQTITTELRGEEINTKNPDNLPYHTNNKFVDVRLHWKAPE